MERIVFGEWPEYGEKLGRRPIGRVGVNVKHNIGKYLKGIGRWWSYYVAAVWDEWWPVVITVMNLRMP
jgi:hypothetical protein